MNVSKISQMKQKVLPLPDENIIQVGTREHPAFHEIAVAELVVSGGGGNWRESVTATLRVFHTRYRLPSSASVLNLKTIWLWVHQVRETSSAQKFEEERSCCHRQNGNMLLVFRF